MVQWIALHVSYLAGERTDPCDIGVSAMAWSREAQSDAPSAGCEQAVPIPEHVSVSRQHRPLWCGQSHIMYLDEQHVAWLISLH